MYATHHSKSEPTIVVFVDIGHCDTQVTVASFKEGGMEIVSHSFDPNLGGRDFDDALFKHFAAQFKEKYKIDVYSNARASIRLRASCEKVKKVLSANAEAPVSIKSLVGDTDVTGLITRNEFERLSLKLLERVIVPCFKAVEDSGISIDKINTIELVGSGSRVPAIMRILTMAFKKEPTRKLKASECVGGGCALHCAMLSPTLIVRDYKVKDIFPYSVALSYDEVKNKSHQELMLFPKGSPIPSDKMTIHNGSPSFSFQLSYTNKMDFPAGISSIVGHFEIGKPEIFSAEKVKVEFKLNDNGIVEIKSASVIEGKRSAPRTLSSYLENLGITSHTSKLEFSENLDVSTTEDELREAQEKEKMFAEIDKKAEELRDQRNNFKSFVNETRSKLLGAWRSFATDSEKEVIMNSLQETKDWLFEDSDDELEPDYTEKLEDLKKLLDPIESRYKDKKVRAEETKPLLTCIEEYHSFANSLSTRSQKVNNECIKALHWLNSYYSSHKSVVDPETRLPISIKDVIEKFERRSKYIIGSDKRDKRDSNPRDQSVEYCVQPSLTHETDETRMGLAKEKNTIKVEQTKEKRHIHGKSLDQNDNENNDENARVQAIKPLVNCLEEYRLISGLLPPSQKEEVNNECSRVEQWLNDLSQQNSSNKNIDPVRLTRIIKDAMEYLERRCKRIMSS